MRATSSNQSHYPALDGLRGAAILLVVFLHNFGFTNYFFFGWLGVDLFFVLSGFLITNILMNSLGKPGFLRNFFVRRVLRIFPLYYFTLIICLLVFPHIKDWNFDFSYYTDHQLWLWTYLQNWLYTFNPPHGTQILLHFWSLGVEEQFYIVWPFIILFVRRPKILLAIVTAILIIVGVARYLLWIYDIKDLAYASLYTFTRIDGICVGCMIALIWRINPHIFKKYISLIVVFLAAVNFGFYFLNHEHSFTLPYLAFVGYTTIAMLFGILVFEVVEGNSKIISFFLGNRFLRFFGSISYGLYVFHWPINLLLIPYLKNVLLNQIMFSASIAETGSAVIATIVAILISVISHRYFESYFLRLKRKFV